MSDRQAVEELRRKIESHEAAGFSVGFYRNADIRAALSLLHEKDEQLAALRQRHANLVRGTQEAASGREKLTRQLDALLRVWCSGGCRNGVLRWLTDDNHPPHDAPHPEVTEEIVAFAEENTRRLRTWYENHKA